MMINDDKKIQTNNIELDTTTKKWYSLDIGDIWETLASRQEGLAISEAADRLKKYGLNKLPEKKADPAWMLLLSQFNSPLMYLMMLATVISLFVGHNSDTIFIVVVMISNALVGFYQEHKANKSLQSLKSFVKFKARVLRGGSEQEILASEIVPGDIVILRSGDRVPADGRIFECKGLKINESSLTGESKAVEKQPSAVSLNTEIGDQTCMAFMGTLVEDGSARITIVETGIKTQYGDIVKMLEETAEEPTPLQRTVVSLSKIVGIFISLVVVLILLEGYIAGRPFEEIFAVALALFVSAIPEGLLPAITIVLTIGMRRIIRHKGLVRRLASTETLGGVTVICTDKTGTLTEGKMEVQQILTAGMSEAINNGSSKSLSPAAALALTTAIITSDAYIENPDQALDQMVIRGKPTEQAFLKAGIQSGIRKDLLEKEYKSLDTIFFSSDRKYSATLRGLPSGERVLYMIGAPEKIVERATHIKLKEKVANIKGPEFSDLMNDVNSFVNQGYRLVACAYREMSKSADSIGDDVDQLILIGFIALNDPVRQQVPEAFKQTQGAGIRTVIVTGDHQMTARAVAEKIGFKISPDEILEGHQIENMSDDELKEMSKTILLYARVSPRHKLRIVQAFQEQGEVVAMFGDGVNDAPALKAANIGVAVNTEVDAAREVADIVLLDSGFNTIVKAIEQGRVIFNNIRRVFFYLITQDFSQFFIFLVSIALGLPLPLIAAQLLFVNLVESGLPDLALTTENDYRGIMNEKPRKPTESIVNNQAIKWMISAFTISGGIAIIFYYFVLQMIGDIEKVRTMVMVLLCMEALFLSLSLRSFKKSIFRKDLFSNYWLTGAVSISFVMILLAIYFTPLRELLSLSPLSPYEWVIILSANVLEIILIDRFKLIFLAVNAGARKVRKAFA